MDLILEIIFELLFEGAAHVAGSKKVPKWIRYPLAIIILLFIAAIIGLILWIGISSLKENIFGGIIAILIGLVLLVCGVMKLKKYYNENIKEHVNGDGEN